MSNSNQTQRMLFAHKDVGAFCQTCPHPQDVTTVLQSLGFRVGFQMNADDQQAYMQLKPLPAQIHYEGPGGMNIVYLAGEDIDIDDEHVFPKHASRFWLYCAGEPEQTFQYTLDTLANAFSLSWELLTIATTVPHIQDAA